jgi:SlyX protein
LIKPARRRNVGDWGTIVDEKHRIDIETKLAHQEHLLAELNEALSDQQAQIGRLERLCQTLIDRIKSLAEGTDADPPSDERPPHY